MNAQAKNQWIKLLLITLFMMVVSSNTFARDRIVGIDSNSKFLIYYGNDYSAGNVNSMKAFDMVVLQAGASNCTPSVVEALQNAGVKVLGYISIGEDYIDPSESPIVHDSAGPIYLNESTNMFVMQNNGIASFYVDSIYNNASQAYVHDGIADTNGTFGGAYIYPNADWRWVLNEMRIGGSPGIFMDRLLRAGLKQIAGARGANLTDRTKDFGFDGFFLDTIDTAGPYENLQGVYPWASEEMTNTVKFISDTYPNKLVMANRGLFYFHPALYNSTYNVRPIEHSIRPYVNAIVFESYRLDTVASNAESPSYIDNKYNVGPKMMAEANRPDGFNIFGIDYMMGRGTAAYDQFFQEAVKKNGWTEYLSFDRDINTIETYIANKLPDVDTASPEWLNTSAGFNTVVSPRIGVQKLALGANTGEIIVSWDNAKDQSWPIKYNIYIASQADFSNAIKYSAVAFEKGEGWDNDPVNNVANQFLLTGISSGTYYVRVRAEDSSPSSHEDSNTETLSITLGESVPAISSPTSGATLSGASQSFVWATNGTSATDWWMQVGSSLGADDIYNSGSLGVISSHSISVLPTDASTLYVRLWYYNNSWLYVDSSYTADNSGGVPSLTSPAPGSTLSGSSVNFSWNANGTNVSEWWLYAGSSVGSSSYLNSGSLGGATSHQITALPVDGSTVHIRLWYKNAGTWKSVDSSYIADTDNSVIPAISSPLANSTLSGASETFSWVANGATVTEWWLYAGSSVGANDLYDSGSLGVASSDTITTLPIDGSTVYIRLWYKSGSWKSVDTLYTAYTGALPSISSPSPNTTLSGVSETFSWTTNGSSVSEWWLYAGNSVGASDIADSGSLGSASSYTVTNIPTNGSTVFIRLWYKQGSWKSLDYTYTQATSNGNTYYVAVAGSNSNSGSMASPWHDIQFGVNQLEAGDTLIVNPGTYHETVLFSGSNDSGTSSADITLKGLNGAIIDGSGLTPSGEQGLIGIHNASYITIENFELRNFKTSTGFNKTDTPLGILIDGSSHDLTINNNTIHHIENLSTCTEPSGCGPSANGIGVFGNTTTSISNITFNQNEVSHCILASSEAFTLNGNIDGFRLVDNYVHDNNNIGIDFIGYESDICPSCTAEQNRARNGVVRGNRSINNSIKLALGSFSSNPWYNGEDGNAGGFYVDGGRNILFDGNYSSQNDLGFEFASEHSQKSSEDILMINNFIYQNRELGLSLGGYSENTQSGGGGSARNIHVYNNSFYKNKGWGSEIVFQYRVIDTTIANNIFYGEDGVSDNFEMQANGQYQNISWGTNIWWAPDVSDTSGIQGASIVQNPLYISASTGNLNIQSSSPAISQGVVQADLTNWTDTFWNGEFTNGIIPAHGTQDINGGSRFNNQLDMGADEF